MLPAIPEILVARQGFADAQEGMKGSPSVLGFYNTGWYGTNTSDERGSFAIVNDAGPLANFVGDFLNVTYQRRSVYVYVIGSQSNLLADLALSRRAFLAISLLAKDPIIARVASVQ